MTGAKLQPLDIVNSSNVVCLLGSGHKAKLRLWYYLMLKQFIIDGGSGGGKVSLLAITDISAIWMARVPSCPFGAFGFMACSAPIR